MLLQNLIVIAIEHGGESGVGDSMICALVD